MKFNYKLFIKILLTYIAISIFSIVLSTILGRTILFTIANAIFGEEKGLTAAEIIMRIFLFAIIFIVAGIINRKRINTSENKKLYLNTLLKNQPYVLKNDIKIIMKDTNFFNEFLAMSLIVVVYSLLFKNLWFIIGSLFFALYNGWLYTLLHKDWAQNRIRLPQEPKDL